MFLRTPSTQENKNYNLFTSPQNHSSFNQECSGINKTTEKFLSESSKVRREDQRQRIRYFINKKIVNYQGVKFDKFRQQLQSQNNPYSLLITIFTITQQFTWRHYIKHLQLLIKKFTNFIEVTQGSILQQLSMKEMSKKNNGFGGFQIQQKIQTILHLADRELQDHILIFIQAFLVHNLKYCILDQNRLSQSLVYRKGYEKYVRIQVLWLLTRMSVSSQAVFKIIKNYPFNQNSSTILPILTILANLIVEKPINHIEGLVQDIFFQQIIQEAIFSTNYEIQRQAVLVCNNIICKSQNCRQYIRNQSNLIQKIVTLDNEEVGIFVELFKSQNCNQ